MEVCAFASDSQAVYKLGVARLKYIATMMTNASGLGFAASRAPKPGQARFKSLMTHTVFGIGLYLWGLLLSPLLFR